jgi:hypothetical protein
LTDPFCPPVPLAASSAEHALPIVIAMPLGTVTSRWLWT